MTPALRSRLQVLASLIMAALVTAIASCSHSRRIEFVLCPDDVHAAMSRVGDLGQRRELLFPLDYEVVVIERTGGAVTPANVLRAGHSTSRPRPTTTSLANPTHVSDYFILEATEAEVGVAIRHAGDTEYRVQWLTEDDLNSARATSVIHLQPLASLPRLTP